MQTVDIATSIEEMLNKKIFKEWKHEGCVEGTYTNGVRCTIDGKEYIIEVREGD